MKNYILHKIDGTESAGAVQVSHETLLSQAPEGWVWSEVDGEPWNWLVQPDGTGFKIVANNPTPPPLDPVIARSYKWNHAKNLREALTNSYCMTPKGVVDCDEQSRLKIALAAQAAADDSDFVVGWTMHDNSCEEHLAEEMIAMNKAVAQFVSDVHAVGVTLRNAINSATTLEEIESIDVDGAPWPS